MIDTLRGFLDQLADAGLDEAQALALDQDLQQWTERLRPRRVPESERTFGRVQDVPGRGQVVSPAFIIDHQDALSLRARVTFGAFHHGANGAAHGGVVALLFDELLGLPVNVDVSTIARTAYLHVNYRAITPINRELQATATVTSVDGRKKFVRGELRDGDTLCADAEGLFVELRAGQP
ncbi:PaaI family thioesterase [Caulobacter soli]|uniref:PaaI family thioesterase n=1 Tax=Caulobacter soli TaxID=2708539 RepID=UPI0013E9CD8D|nr:PaaI family thioesterase [Caulobacter soli]